MGATAELRTLDTIELRGCDGGAAERVVAVPRAIALLAYLALARPRGFHRRATLWAALWPATDDGDAAQLDSLIALIRRELGDSVLLDDAADGVAIDETQLLVDATLFERAIDDGRGSEAIGLYRGPLLPTLRLDDAPTFNQWLGAERDRLAALAGELALALAEHHTGHPTLAVTYARRAVELSRSEEAPLHRLANLLEELGDRVGADQASQRLARASGRRAMIDAPGDRGRSAESGDAAASPFAGARSPARADRPRTDARFSPSSVPAPASGDGAPECQSPFPQIADYVIEREIGRGGMAHVYLARDVKRGRAVAIKMLRPELAEEDGTERFLREIEITAGLAHPHIIPLLDSGLANGVPYYVTPFIEGETLADRLQREGPLPIPDAVRVAREVADALDYAHRHGVVHRDVKPENILFADGHALVADFGIARAAERSGALKITAQGRAVGSPSYMSPEQSIGEDLDGRADVYSLGCVLFEMLTGRIPYEAKSSYEMMTRHATDPIPSLRARRAETPSALEVATRRALAKKPADRFASARAFADAIDDACPPPVRPRARPVRVSGVMGGRSLAAAGVILAAIVIAAIVAGGRLTPSGSAAMAVDTTRLVVFPLHGDAPSTASVRASSFLADAFRRWQGVHLVDELQIRDALTSRGESGISGERASTIARSLGAGRYVRGELSVRGDSLQLRATLFDAASDSMVRQGIVQLAPGLTRADSVIARLAERLLFTGDAEALASSEGTASVPARQAYLRGRAAIREWQLPRADSAFDEATRADIGYAAAQLWLAQVRSWREEPPARWSSAIEHAWLGRAKLSPAEQLLAAALRARSAGRLDDACQLHEKLVDSAPDNFAAWYGLANCLRDDEAVIRSARSPSGWRFRSSYHRSLVAYRRAYQLLPAVHRSLGADAFSGVLRLFVTSRRFIHAGSAIAPDTTRFFAYPAWIGDTLTFIPYPRQRMREARPPEQPRTIDEAVARQRALFHDVATSWVAAHPNSGTALEAMALSLELLGDPRARDTLHRARALTGDPRERARLSAHAVWMELKFGLPGDEHGIASARALADSLLAEDDTTRAAAPRVLAGLAALTGRANRTASLARRAVELPGRSPGPIALPAAALLAFAALGGPADSLLALEKQLMRAIEATATLPRVESDAFEWLARPASLAFPAALGATTSFAGRGDPILDAQAAMLRGDPAPARALLEQLRLGRRSVPPTDVSYDGLLPEATLLVRLGDDRQAAAWLDPSLNALAMTAPHALSDYVRAGALVRTMALRAEVAVRLGDREGARRWARAVAILWSDADPYLQYKVARMRAIAR